MPILTFSITSFGLELAVLLGIDQVTMRALQLASAPIPRPIAASALIDTGSDVTCVDRSLLQSITTSKSGHSSTQTLSGRQKVDLFDISLSIPSATSAMFVIPLLTVMELPVSIPKVDVLFGMDVLSHLRLVVDGPKGLFEIHY